MPGFSLRDLGIQHSRLSGSESDLGSRAFLAANLGLDEIAADVCHRALPIENPCCYVAGFPCQPFSALGLGEGWDDSRGRGQMVQFCIDFVRKTRPSTFILENVARLKIHNGGDFFAWLLSELSCGGDYNVRARVINTKTCGLPQSRSRLYLVGTLKSC